MSFTFFLRPGVSCGLPVLDEVIGATVGVFRAGALVVDFDSCAKANDPAQVISEIARSEVV